MAAGADLFGEVESFPLLSILLDGMGIGLA